MATQTRISAEAHARLTRLARQTGKNLVEVIDMALTNLERDLFLDDVNDGFARLNADPRARQAYDAEFEDWDVTLGDGLDGDEPRKRK